MKNEKEIQKNEYLKIAREWWGLALRTGCKCPLILAILAYIRKRKFANLDTILNNSYCKIIYEFLNEFKYKYPSNFYDARIIHNGEFHIIEIKDTEINDKLCKLHLISTKGAHKYLNIEPNQLKLTTLHRFKDNWILQIY